MRINCSEDPKLLMQLAKDGNTEAFGILYNLYFTPVFRYIYYRISDKEEVNDLTQTVFLKVFSALPNFQKQAISPLAYFFTVSRNTVIDYWRTHKTNRIDNPEYVFEKMPDPTHEPVKDFEQHETGIIIRKALETLPDTQQEVIILKFINNLSNKEIAQCMGKTEASIRQLQCRALASLRKILKNNNRYE